MEDIKNIVGKVIQGISEKGPAQKQSIQEFWGRILNKKESGHSKIVEIKEGCLIVLVDSPAWRYQFYLKKKKILEEIQNKFPEIKRIYFKIGKVK